MAIVRIVVTSPKGSSINRATGGGDSGARDRLLQALVDGRDANRELRQALQWGERQLNRPLRADRHAVTVSTFLPAEEAGSSMGQMSRRRRISRPRGQQLAHDAG